MNFRDTWGLAEGHAHGRPLMIRFRQFPQTFDRTKYPDRINVFWKLAGPDENGLPEGDEANLLSTFENRLVDAVEGDQHSVLCAVLSCDGRREFVFHTSDPQGFMDRLHLMPQEETRYPIEIDLYEDRDWSYVNAVTPRTTST
jgi:hypothetical protein